MFVSLKRFLSKKYNITIMITMLCLKKLLFFNVFWGEHASTKNFPFKFGANATSKRTHKTQSTNVTSTTQKY